MERRESLPNQTASRQLVAVRASGAEKVGPAGVLVRMEHPELSVHRLDGRLLFGMV